MTKNNKPFLIAECGINHNGDIDLAKKLIDLAIDCKWNAVKFQTRDLNITIPNNKRNKPRDTPWGKMSYLEYKKRIEFTINDYNEINRYCKGKIPWFSSAWDINSIDLLKRYNLKYNKIASAMLPNKEILQSIAQQKKLTFISTGMSTWEYIDNAVNIFNEYDCPYVLMHCVGIYPCPVDKLNLNMISTLQDRYKCDIGYSGHSPGAMDAIVACALGVNVIEKHITLDRCMWGSDQSASVEKSGMEYIRKHCDNMAKMLGSGKRYISKKEQEVANTLRYFDI